MDGGIVDESVDRIARAIFDRWTRSPVIEFSEGIEDAIFLEAAFVGCGMPAEFVLLEPAPTAFLPVSGTT